MNVYYAPVFAKIVDSSLWCEDDYVIKIFITMLVKKDRDNVCRGSAFNIAQWSRKREEEVIKALKILSSPDKRRLERQAFDGRRIQRMEDGWLILNAAFYQEEMRKANRRSYQALKQREYRARDKQTGMEVPV